MIYFSCTGIYPRKERKKTVAIPETKALKQYNLIGDSIYYHHFRTEAAGEEYLHPSEVHTAHELLLLLEGEISYMIEGEVYTACPGDMIFVAPGEVHSIRIGGEKPYERLVLLFDIGVLERLMQELKVHLNAFAYDGENRLHILPRALVQRYGLDVLLFDILETEDEDRYKRILIMSKLLSFIIRTDKLIAAHKDELLALGERDPFVRAVITYVSTHIAEPIRLDTLASQLFVSKSTLCHRFARAMHMTTNRYITVKKMNLAADMLRKGKTAAEAAAAVGYDNYTSFFYNFKRLMGKPPQALTR